MPRIRLKHHLCSFEGCEYSSYHTGHLATHKRTHTGEKPFICDIAGCEFSTGYKQSLATHKRTHTGEKPFVCDFVECEFSTSNTGSLLKHKRIHTKEKPFVCDFRGCEYSTSQKQSLTTHKRSHTGEKPFVCDFKGCEFSTGYSGTLATHKRTHTDEKPFVCDFQGCEYTSAQSGSLTIHKFYYHTQEGQQKRKREEERIANLLVTNKIDFKREHHIDFSCIASTFSRVDFTLIMGGKTVFLEIDEDQHKSYGVACDISRMAKIYEVLTLEGNTLPVIFIRYNPHAFTNNELPKRVPKRDREARLVSVLHSISDMGHEGLSIIYMYYDVGKERLEIWNDPEYTLQDCCLPPIH